MNCPNCGFNNSDDSTTCTKCGKEISLFKETKSGAKTSVNAKARVQQSRVPTAVAQKENGVNTGSIEITGESTTQDGGMSKAGTKKMLIIGCTAAVVLIGLFVLNLILSSMANPQNTALSYYKSLASHNWDKAYSYIDMPKSEFDTKQAYSQFMSISKNELEKDYKTFSVTDCYNVNSDTVRVTVKTKSGEFLVLTLKRQGKKWLFYDNWKVQISDSLVKSYTLNILKGTKVYVDGVDVDKRYIIKVNDTGIRNCDIYKIQNILTGYHNIKITAPFIKPTTETADADNDQNTGFVSLNYPIKLTETSISDISQRAPELINDVITAAYGNKDFSQVEQDFKLDDFSVNEIKQNYDNFKSYMGSNESFFEGITNKIDSSTFITDTIYNTVPLSVSVNQKDDASKQLLIEIGLVNDNGNWMLGYFSYSKMN